jgi:protein phosphatase
MKTKFLNLLRNKKEAASDTREMERYFNYGSLSDIGLRRSTNQDCFGIFPGEYNPMLHPKGQLFLVADGMGGLSGGRKASEMAVNVIHKVYSEEAPLNISQALHDAFQKANTEIFDEAGSEDLEHHMGTTCSALVLTESGGGGIDPT